MHSNSDGTTGFLEKMSFIKQFWQKVCPSDTTSCRSSKMVDLQASEGAKFTLEETG